MAVWNVIDHQELSGTAASWTKSSIPSSYDHLYLEFSARSDEVNLLQRDEIEINLNADAGSNYSYTALWAGTTTPASLRGSGVTEIRRIWVPNASSTADTFGTGALWIPHYANSANFKQVFVQAASEGATTTNYLWGLAVIAGLWSDTSAVDQITLVPRNGPNFVQYSTFTLYGINGAG